MEIKDSDIFEDFEEQEDYIDYEWVDKECERQRKEEWDKKHNVHRDKRGRLNKGALLASKDSCNEQGILLRYDSGMSVKEIVNCMECSKSTVCLKNIKKEIISQLFWKNVQRVNNI